MKNKIGFMTFDNRIEIIDFGVDPDDDQDYPAVEIGIGYNGTEYADSMILTIPEFCELVAELSRYAMALQARYATDKNG